jgi:glutamyl-tRNA reductase
MTDETLERRKEFVPQAQQIIAEVEGDFNKWLETRKFAPTIKALKKKLKTMKDAELDFQRKKISNFNDEQAEIVSNRIIQKIMNHFANHLKDDSNTTDESLELIQKVFQLEDSHQ